MDDHKTEKVQLLRDDEIFPSEEVLKDCLGDTFSVYRHFMSTIQNEEYQLNPEWRYYRDGKAWLCKVQSTKKTVFWLSVWDGLFKISFYFTEKSDESIRNLGIDKSLIEAFDKNKNIGKLKPLTVEVTKETQVRDILLLISCKKSIK